MRINRSSLLVWLCTTAIALVAAAHAADVNLLINPDFALAYAAQRLTNTNLPYIRGADRLLPNYEDAPVLPYGWTVLPGKDNQGTLSWVDVDGVKALRVRTEEGDRLTLRQTLVELVPGGDYTAGLTFRGTGRIDLRVWANQPAPWQSLVQTTLVAKAEEWTTAERPFSPGPHRHLAGYALDINGKADLLLRNAVIAADTPAIPNVLTQPAVRDEQTLFFENFDGDRVQIKTNDVFRLTEPGGGRFGRGLIVSPADGGSRTHLPFGELPAEGTIEFWFKPSSLPEKVHARLEPLIITTQTPGLKETQIQFVVSHWLGVVNFGFRKERYKHDSAQSTECAGWGRWQPDTWHHFAGSWDGESMRFYLDGVLEGLIYGTDLQRPRGQAIDLVLLGPGVIDDIRISKGQRYGPRIPAGAKPVAYVQPAPSNAVAGATPVPALTDEQRAAERAKLISPLPDAGAEYVFDALQAKPGWDGMTGLTVRSNYFGSGAHALLLKADGEVIGRYAYWRLDGIEPGAYHLGLWTETQTPTYRTEYGPLRLLLTAYVNGWPVRFETTSDPVQVKPKLWLAELRSAEPVMLRPGDEVAFAVAKGWYNDEQSVLRLALHRTAPPRGHGITGRTFGVDHFTPQRVRLATRPEIIGSGKDGEPLEARIEVANPLPYAANVDVTWKLADYYGVPLAGGTERVKIDPHGVSVISNTFVADGDARAYQLDARTRPAPSFKFPVPRPLEMLELNDWTRMEFLPDQPDPLTTWQHARLELAEDRTGGRQWQCLDGNDWEWAWLDGRYMKFPPFFGQVVKPRFWQSHSPRRRERCHGTETEKAFGRV